MGGCVICPVCASDAVERKQAYEKAADDYRRDDPHRHLNILERLQWLYRHNIKGRETASPYVAVNFLQPPVPATIETIARPVAYVTYHFLMDEYRAPTHVTRRWSCMGLTVAEETEFYELSNMGYRNQHPHQL